jgi:SAM-dependent methyltransferase
VLPIPPPPPCPCGGPDAESLAAGVVACRGCGRFRSVDPANRPELPEPVADPAAFAAGLVRRYALTRHDLVVEVGSGDGERLRAVQGLGPRVLGVEPDLRVMARAFHAGVDTIGTRFGAGVGEYVARRYGPARVLVVRGLRAVGCDPAALVGAAAGCLGPGGVLVAEVLVGGVARLVELEAAVPVRVAA